MAEVNHVERLRSDHQELNAQIDVLNGCPGVKSEEVVPLKRARLRLRDRIAWFETQAARK